MSQLETDRYTSKIADIEVGNDRGTSEKAGKIGTTLLAMAKSAQAHAQAHATGSVKNAWSRAYRAFNNQHVSQSKYHSEAYRGRSKLFRPKTRSAVRKNEASAAQALFSTVDTVSIKPTSQDLKSTVSGLVLHEVINFRFDRSSGKDGIPWFMMAMGARQNSMITGMCISKQYWQYKIKPRPASDVDPVRETMPAPDLMGISNLEMPKEDESYLDEDQDGQNEVQDDIEDGSELEGEDALAAAFGFGDEVAPEPEPEVEFDRPWLDLIAPENVVLDPAAPWYNPVQEGGYLRVRFPLHIHEARAMMASGSGEMGGGKWHKVSEDILKRNTQRWYAATIRRARDGRGSDRYDEVDQMGELATVWVTENFFRFEGVDYHFWSVDEEQLLSDPVPVEVAYPAFKGVRPYVGGFGAIEAHKVNPMSPVESWQPLQQESNDLANLRLDNIKQHLSPLTKVRRGQNVDTKNLRNRGPDATVMLNNLDDIMFDRPADVSGSAYTEQNYISADFDDLAGAFSGSSVQNNRALNETVGGMQLLAGSANGLTEYDLRVWTETWVEPAIRQIVQLEQYYEDNPKILAIAGQRADVWRKFQLDTLDPDMLEGDVLVSVDVGMGAVSPEQQAQKLGSAFSMLGNLAPFLDRSVKVNAEEVGQVIFGYHGFKDGMRFLVMDEPGQQQQENPEAIKMKLEAEQEQAKLASQERIEEKKIDGRLQERAMTNQFGLLEAAIGFDLEREITAGEQAFAASMGGAQNPAPSPRQPSTPAQPMPQAMPPQPPSLPSLPALPQR